MASRYESKLGEIEAAMRELVGQNRSLKEELRLWASEGTDLALPPMSVRGSAAGAACLLKR